MDFSRLLVLVQILPEDVKLDSRSVGQPGKERMMHTQRGFYKTPGLPYPQKFKFSLPDKVSTPWPAGWYALDPNSFTTGDYDSLELSRYDFNIIPLSDEVKKLFGIVGK